MYIGNLGLFGLMLFASLLATMGLLFWFAKKGPSRARRTIAFGMGMFVVSASLVLIEAFAKLDPMHSKGDIAIQPAPAWIYNGVLTVGAVAFVMGLVKLSAEKRPAKMPRATRSMPTSDQMMS